MKNRVASILVGIGAFLLAFITGALVLALFNLAFRQATPSSLGVRQFLAGLAAVTTLVAAFGVLFALPWFVSARWETNPWLAVGVGGLLAGATSPYWVFVLAFGSTCELHIRNGGDIC